MPITAALSEKTGGSDDNLCQLRKDLESP